MKDVLKKIILIHPEKSCIAAIHLLLLVHEIPTIKDPDCHFFIEPVQSDIGAGEKVKTTFEKMRHDSKNATHRD